jgi:Tfp pilus assembly protein PilF
MEREVQLLAQHQLAIAYEANGQIDEAVKLLKHVVTVEEKKLASQHALARAYQANGQLYAAVELLKHVVTVKRRRYAKTHPSRIVLEEVLDDLLQSMQDTT